MKKTGFLIAILLGISLFISCNEPKDPTKDNSEEGFVTIKYDGDYILLNSGEDEFCYPEEKKVRIGTFLTQEFLPELSVDWKKSNVWDYEFEYWTIGKDGDKDNVYMFEVKEDITLYAHWKKEEREVMDCYDGYLIIGEEEIQFIENGSYEKADYRKVEKETVIFNDKIFLYDYKDIDETYFKTKLVFKDTEEKQKPCIVSGKWEKDYTCIYDGIYIEYLDPFAKSDEFNRIFNPKDEKYELAVMTDELNFENAEELGYKNTEYFKHIHREYLLGNFEENYVYKNVKETSALYYDYGILIFENNGVKDYYINYKDDRDLRDIYILRGKEKIKVKYNK